MDKQSIRNMVMGVVALTLILVSVPTQLLVLHYFMHSILAQVFCVFLSVLVAAIGLNLTSLAFDVIDWVKKKKSRKGLHGRRSAARMEA